MRDVIESIRERTTVYERHPLFEFLRDSRIDPSRRLAFAPSAAHYSLSFKDLCQLVLREEPARDRIQEIVNALTYEEAVHSRWLLASAGRCPAPIFSMDCPRPPKRGRNGRAGRNHQCRSSRSRRSRSR
jgi:hypothetical protein